MSVKALGAVLLVVLVGVLPGLARAQDACTPDTDDSIPEWSESEFAAIGNISAAQAGVVFDEYGRLNLSGWYAGGGFHYQESDAERWTRRLVLQMRMGFVALEGVVPTDWRGDEKKPPLPMAAPADAYSRATEGSMTNPMSCSGVVLSTGEKVTVETDFVARQSNGLSFKRTFRSAGAGGYFFGPNWASDYDPVKYTISNSPCIPTDSGCYPPSITMTFPKGASYTYTLNLDTQDGAYDVVGSAALGKAHYRLFNKTANLVMPERTYAFDSQRRQTRVLGRDGASVTYTYGTDGSLSTITNAAGQKIQFTWGAGNKVASITDPAGQTWTYGYHANGQLATVTSPGSPADVREYHYEHAADVKLLTGVSVNGVRYSTYKYDGTKRAVESGLTGGEHKARSSMRPTRPR